MTPAIVLGPAPCADCGRGLYLIRYNEGGGLFWCSLHAGRGGMWERHSCDPRCGARMAHSGERCARTVGHKGDHRSRLLLTEESQRRRRAA